MGETAGVLLFLLSCLAALWSLAGLLRPRLVLWWAVPEKQTRGRAFGFALFAALTFFFLAMTFVANVKWWVWLLDALCLGALFYAACLLRTSKEELEALLKAREREEKARLTRTAYSMTSDKEYELRPFLAQCSCPDWEERRVGAFGPFRICKHLSGHYALHKEELPDELKPYAALIANFGYEDKGVPPQGAFYGYGVTDDGGMAYLMTGYDDSLPWVDMYTDFSTERYGFNLETGRWAKGKEPPFAEMLAQKALDRSKGTWSCEGY